MRRGNGLAHGVAGEIRLQVLYPVLSLGVQENLCNSGETDSRISLESSGRRGNNQEVTAKLLRDRDLSDW